MTYKIMDDNLCCEKNIDGLIAAKGIAGTIIDTIPFGDIGTFTIVNESTDQVVLTRHMVVEWI